MITWFRLSLKSLVHYRAIYLSILIGAALSTAILTGALIVGDSVTYSLQQLTKLRLGKISYIVAPNERFFNSDLADRLGNEIQSNVVSILQLQGIALNDKQTIRINKIDIIGVPPSFWQFADGSKIDLQSDEVAVNEKVAEKLNLKVGDRLFLRIGQPSIIPMNAPFVADNNFTKGQLFTVNAIITDNQLGRFSLKTNQSSPANVFISHTQLSQLVDMKGKANVILLEGKPEVDLQRINSALNKVWALQDANLIFRTNVQLGVHELISERIFIEQQAVQAAHEIDNVKASFIFTYFVNSIKNKTLETPYSFITALDTSLLGLSLTDHEIVLNKWTADDIAAQTGDTVELSYFIIGALRQIVEERTKFVVKAVVAQTGIAADTSLMPVIPGLSDAKNCRDWQTGIPIDWKKIRKKDEDYWREFSGTPKAFVSHNIAQQLWKNRYGSHTAIRFDAKDITRNKLELAIRNKLSPAAMGFVAFDVKTTGMQSANEAVDFGELFLSLSFFILAAGVLLTILLFALNIEYRSSETGTLLALGFTTQSIKKLFLVEGLIIAIISGVIGSLLGVAYNTVILKALAVAWQDAVRTTYLLVDVRFSTLLIGALSGTIISLLSIYIALRRKVKQEVVQIQKNIQKVAHKKWLSRNLNNLLLWGSLALTIALFAMTGFKPTQENAPLFLTCGALLLIFGIAHTNWILTYFDKMHHTAQISFTSMSLRNNTRRRGRSLASVALLAIGTFAVISTGMNRKDLTTHADRRESGTGGFRFWGETTLPILYDLNSMRGKQYFNLDTAKTDSVSFVQLSVYDGDDASCLNLNRVIRPRILGVNPTELADRQAFSFATFDKELPDQNVWLSLKNTANDLIPAIADQTVIQWGLGKKVGDTLHYLNEAGEQISLKLIAGLSTSVFQGSVIISDSAFRACFPSISGSHVVLVDAKNADQEKTAEMLTTNLRDLGLELTSTHVRLAEFNSVTNTYLSIFLALGGLGVLIGTIGFGIILIRQVLERRSELAILKAIGFQRRKIILSLYIENLFLLSAGLLTGVIAALVAALPSLFAPAVSLPVNLMFGIVAAIFINGLICIFIAALLSIRGNTVAALRND